ncbi:MAG TPA: hypothetical protein VHO70_11720, partial [Chitinispirillaceae bacterium]|nr:hypothetical protein [Chitinispirillaceae bacterium]
DKRISIELSYNGLHPLVSGNKIELESALLNICINAIEAMSGSGTLRIGVSFLEKQDRQNICESAGTFTKCIKIEISDTGLKKTGINDNETINKLEELCLC